MTLINYQATVPTSMSSGKFFAGLLPKEYCLMNIPILRSEHMMFWTLLLRNFLTPINETGEKTPFQRSRFIG